MKAYFAAAAATLVLAQAPAIAQAPGAAGPSNEPKVNQIYIYGDDPCPASTNDLINVCFRLPNGDRYRIPENLRSDPNDPTNQAWATRARALEYVGRSGIGSCSPVGGGGVSGCFNQIVQQARAERQGDERVDWEQLIQRARDERMRRIGDAQTAIRP